MVQWSQGASQMFAPELFYSVVTACIFFFWMDQHSSVLTIHGLCVTNLLDTILLIGFDGPYDAIWRISSTSTIPMHVTLEFCTSLLLCTYRFGANFHPDAILSMVGADCRCGNQRRRESLPCFTTKQGIPTALSFAIILDDWQALSSIVVRATIIELN